MVKILQIYLHNLVKVVLMKTSKYFARFASWREIFSFEFLEVPNNNKRFGCFHSVRYDAIVREK